MGQNQEEQFLEILCECPGQWKSAFSGTDILWPGATIRVLTQMVVCGNPEFTVQGISRNLWKMELKDLLI